MKKLFTLLLLACTAISAQAKRHYVDLTAVGLNNGTSWEDAWTDLAYNIHNTTVSAGDTVWVANGTYTGTFPDVHAFHVHVNLVMYGGFNGTETLLSQRNFSGHATILQGSNSYANSVFTNIAGGRLDGFRITHVSHPVVQNTHWGIFVGNGFVLANCLITNNFNVAPVTVGGPADIINCQFINNGPSSNHPSSPVKGTALICGGNVNITDCLFKNNQGNLGGAVRVIGAGVQTVNRCTFYGNSASVSGGAIYDTSGSKLRIFNSVFVGNKAPLGGAHYSPDSLNATRNFTHCTIANNWSSNASAKNYALWLNGTKDTLRNCIIWGDSTGTGPEIANPKTGAVFNKNVIEGGGSIFGATATYTFNPMFVSPGNVNTAPFPAATSHNYHLQPASQAIDTGANLALAAPLNLDLDGQARFQGRFPDLGAYEWKVCAWHNVTISASGPTTFCLPDSVTLTANANPVYNHTYQWNGATAGRSITVKTSGVHKVVIIDSLGCQAAASVTVNAVPVPNPTITQSGNKLSVPATYATYQWYLGGNPISGATTATHTATSYGSYTVRVTTTIGNCAGTSAAYSLLNLGVGGTSLEHAVRIYPNPGDGHLTVSMEGQPKGALSIIVRTITGQEVSRQQHQLTGNPFSELLDISEAAKGIYFVELINGNDRIVKKVIVH